MSAGDLLISVCSNPCGCSSGIPGSNCGTYNTYTGNLARVAGSNNEFSVTLGGSLNLDSCCNNVYMQCLGSCFIPYDENESSSMISSIQFAQLTYNGALLNQVNSPSFVGGGGTPWEITGLDNYAFSACKSNLGGANSMEMFISIILNTAPVHTFDGATSSWKFTAGT